MLPTIFEEPPYQEAYSFYVRVEIFLYSYLHTIGIEAMYILKKAGSSRGEV
jgi:hypothetical protein